MNKHQHLLDTFLEICRIPHGTGNESALREMLIEKAAGLGLPHKVDEAGNLSITIPAAPGMEAAPGILLQAHLDMVCVAEPGLAHDFTTQGLDVIEEEGWLTARGTSLGADNGVGCAMAMGIAAEKELRHGPLQLLFTVEEETGMQGMIRMPADFIDPAMRYAVNIDFEAEEYICIGCAGGLVVNARGEVPCAQYDFEQKEKYSLWRVKAGGVQGGHSGLEIDGRPLNLHHTMFTLLEELHGQLLSYAGGDAVNSIPAHAEMVIATPRSQDEKVQAAFAAFAETFSEQYTYPGGVPSLTLESLIRRPFEGLSMETTYKLAALIRKLPDGVLSRHEALGGSPQSSSNLGVVHLNDQGFLHLGLAVRSDSPSESLALKEQVLTSLKEIPELDISADEFPIWQPQPENALVQHCQAGRQGLFDEAATLISVHAGIECALLVSKKPDLQAVSIGPIIQFVHSPRERANIQSMQRVYDWLLEIIRTIDSMA